MEILEPYRARLDALDDKIVALIAERIGIIREVGALKAREKIPAVLQDRVDAVRERAAAKAADLGVDPEFVRQLYARIIAFSCELEEQIRLELSATSVALGE